jgi:thioredoxin reductase
LVLSKGCEERAVNIAILRDDCDVAVIGAGPYGLAVAAHLRSAKISTRVFGAPMAAWRAHMPKGMRLRSPWSASHIADPSRRFSLDAFAVQHALPRQDHLPLDQFTRYGEWFQRQTVRDLDTRQVVRIEDAGRGFCVLLEDGAALHAKRVVVATGLAGQEYRPAAFEGLPAALVSHTCEHASFEKWRGKRVAVIGRGQSACESAALLRESANEVDLICRGEVRFEGAHEEAARQGDRAARWRVRLAAPSAVGSFPFDWLNGLPGAVHRAPAPVRSFLNARSLRPAAADWLRPRLAAVRVFAHRKIVNARVIGNQVGLQLNDGLRVYDQVVLGTGYRVDVARLGFLSPTLQDRISCAQRAPVLSAGFESSVPGLHFVGASAFRSFGPLMYFVAGAGHAARSITRTVLAERQRQADRIAETRKELEANAAENALL